jgi:hypothetical protein
VVFFSEVRRFNHANASNADDPHKSLLANASLRHELRCRWRIRIGLE